MTASSHLESQKLTYSSEPIVTFDSFPSAILFPPSTRLCVTGAMRAVRDGSIQWLTLRKVAIVEGKVIDLMFSEFVDSFPTATTTLKDLGRLFRLIGRKGLHEELLVRALLDPTHRCPDSFRESLRLSTRISAKDMCCKGLA